MNECIPRAAHVIPDSGQYYLISADGSGVYEQVTRDFIHYSVPRPLIQAADAEGITGWSSPHLSGDTLAVTVDTAEGRHGIRLFTTQEFMPGISRFRPEGGILTPPDWDCTDGKLFFDQLFFTRRSVSGRDIYRILPGSRRDPQLILPGGESPVLWLAPGERAAMLYFRQGKAAAAAQFSPWVSAWTEIPLPIEIEGVSASLYEEPDGGLIAMITREDGGTQFCHLEWMDGGCALIPREGI
ncbi:MAG: hypothetical protein E7662_01010 [Ruminococcaceae bacterium]|nr:hypothetical protein [Oscillospiraceae bacterium]